MGGELVGLPQTEVGKEPVKGRLKTAYTCTLQFLGGHIPGRQCVYPASEKLVMRAEVLIDADEVLISLVGLDLRRSRGTVLPNRPKNWAGAGRSRKVVVEHCRQGARNVGLEKGWSLNGENLRLARRLARSFVVQKKESLVLDDRAAHRTTELILMERCLRTLVKEVTSIQSRVSSGVEHRPVELVAAGLGDDINDRTIIATVFRGEVQRLNLYLLNCIQRRKDERSTAQPFIIVRIAIQNEVVAARSGAVGNVAVKKGYRRSW